MDERKIDGLLYDQECPFGYRCLAVDCMECVDLHTDIEGACDES